MGYRAGLWQPEQNSETLFQEIHPPLKKKERKEMSCVF
jgi:hypothetical protein